MNATNEVMKELRLTDKQWEFLSHRLEVPEAIADAIAGEGEDNWHRDDVIYVADCLESGDWDAATCHNPTLRDDVLRDCIQGGTRMAGEHTIADLQVARTLAVKIGKFLGEQIDYPES